MVIHIYGQQNPTTRTTYSQGQCISGLISEVLILNQYSTGVVMVMFSEQVDTCVLVEPLTLRGHIPISMGPYEEQKLSAAAPLPVFI